jgi:hypothetical protein
MSFDEILRFLTQPPPLLSAAFGYFGGVVTLIFSPSIQQWANDRLKRHRLRRVFYCELSEIFLTVEGILEFDKLPEAQLWYSR